MVLRTGAILLWCACLIMAGMIVTDIVQNGVSALAHRLWQPVGLALGFRRFSVLGCRLWALAAGPHRRPGRRLGAGSRRALETGPLSRGDVDVPRPSAQA